uniref:Si:ch73-23l24.1 n=1 Tax=Erpetoichthys calabaricus TaxID=27687 RepID=A0A8C4RIH7_ERPCA
YKDLFVINVFSCSLLRCRSSGRQSREKRDMPNWSYSASDFFAWVEQLRSHAGYEKMDELARTFWAHFPSAARLGYEQPHSDE